MLLNFMVVVLRQVLPHSILSVHSSCKLKMKGFSNSPLAPVIFQLGLPEDFLLFFDGNNKL